MRVGWDGSGLAYEWATLSVGCNDSGLGVGWEWAGLGVG
jgi:hypothetical protein